MQAATPLRILSPKLLLQGSGNGQALENVIPDTLPNGSLCYVIEEESFYRLDKFSTTAVAAPAIIATIRGAGVPGRWKILDFSGETGATGPTGEAGAAGSPGATGPTGSGGDFAPLSNVLFVDGGTAVPGPSQNGSIARPFSTITAALAASGGSFSIYVTPGDYSSEAELTWTGTRFFYAMGFVFMPEVDGDTGIFFGRFFMGVTALAAFARFEGCVTNGVTAPSIELIQTQGSGAYDGDVSADYYSYIRCLTFGDGTFPGTLTIFDGPIGAFYEATTDSNTAATAATTNFVAITGADFIERTGTSFWVFDPSGAVATYQLSSISRWKVTLVVSLAPADPPGAITELAVGIDFSGDLLGTAPAAGAGGQTLIEMGTDGAIKSIACERIVSPTALTDTIQPVIAYADTEDLGIERVTMTVTPA